MHSIQDFLKRINRSLTGLDLISLLVTMLFLLGLALFLRFEQASRSQPLSYIVSTSTQSGEVQGLQADSRPFASKNGKTYTFAWCNGSGNIAAKNKIYFGSEAEAQNSGRTLSKLCQK